MEYNTRKCFSMTKISRNTRKRSETKLGKNCHHKKDTVNLQSMLKSDNV